MGKKTCNFVYAGALIIFGAMALSCGSSQNTQDFYDGFREGYNAVSNGYSSVEVPVDSIAVSDGCDMAIMVTERDK